MSKTKLFKNGISLRTVHVCLIIGAVIISCLMFYSTFKLSASFRNMAEANEQQIELRGAAEELLEASDYLTERAQRFTVAGEQRFLNEYFDEAFKAQHREEAIERMAAGKGSEQALARLKLSMDSSVVLMEREYYAMRLVIEAKGYTEYPELLRSVELSAEDLALDAGAKMRRATGMLLDEEYYLQKEQVRNNIKDSLSELEKLARDTDDEALEKLRKQMDFVRVVIVAQALGIVVMVWLTSRLGIHPVLNAVERIKADSPIPEVGANEFRYLARAYNKMYEVYRSSLERLNFKASHDELTGAYNRAGYQLLLSGLDLSSTYMLLFDIDDFKSINDTCGHEAGDRALQKLVRILKSRFRSDDYVCRIGGDEFVVFMSHVTKLRHSLISAKIEQINAELEKSGEGLPAFTVSVGVVHGTQAHSIEDLFEKTDSAMYKAKQSGKRAYRFYTGSRQ